MSGGRPALVSAIIPFYNTPEAFLREAVDSALAQTSVTLELLLVDDGSDPTTARIARGLVAGGDGRTRYLTHPGGKNLGISATRNLGVAEAAGEYVAFLDSDDVWLPGKLSEQVEILDRTPQADMVFGLSDYWYQWNGGPLSATARVPDAGARSARLITPPAFVSDFLRGRIIVPNPSNFMVRRNCYLELGGFDESFPGMYEDQVFFAKVGLQRGVYVAPRCWDKYRQHPESVTARARESATEDASRRRFLSWLRDYCRQRGLDYPAVREAIAKELWLCPAPDGSGDIHFDRRTRWLKKWLLRIEELIVPERLRRKIWASDDDA